ncbi:MAG: Dam family site-specific DNA-(adenine-N6)-methyltransferase [Vicinamibacterales bacterium]
MERSGVRPFLKWAGGKRQLLPELRRYYPAAPGAYFEPFLGSGAVFFDLIKRRRLDGQAITLSDDNADLIGCYLRLRDGLEAVLPVLDELAVGHAADGVEFYKRVRDERANPERAAWFRAGGAAADYPAELAAMLIYLNRTGYNGLFRLNSQGGFNVPPGRYDRPRIVDRPLLEAVSQILQAATLRIVHAPFDHVLDAAQDGDFVYFDPPYAPMSPTSNFRGYTSRGFGEADQQRLQHVVVALALRGVHVLLSNSTAPGISQLYERNLAARAAGLRAWRIPARRAINSKADRRGTVNELVVSNVARQKGPLGEGPAAVESDAAAEH